MTFDALRPIIIITDAASRGDDLVAIAMLLGSQRAEVKLIVATSGNVWAEESSLHVRHLLSRLQRNDIPVCNGLASAAFDHRAALVRGENPSQALRYVGAFARERPSSTDGDRCRNLFEVFEELDRPDLLVIGPASPLASVARDYPQVSRYAGRVFLMGGAVACEGNATPSAEFNFWFDPEAADSLLASDLPITLLPLDAIRTLRYSPEFAATLNPAHPVTAYIRDAAKDPHALMACDEVLAALMLSSAVACRCEKLKLSVETKPGLRYGAVNVLDGSANRRPVEVIKEIDEKAFWLLAHRTLAQGG
jgi:inosine-uridine nucleoside N-ribohydrolase